MSKFELSKEETFVGEWFLPPDGKAKVRAISGALKWTMRRAKLELHDCFTQTMGDIYGDEFHEYAVVHGRSIKNDLISLVNATGTIGAINFGHGAVRQTEVIRSSMLVVGAHVEPDSLYTDITARIPGLELWLNGGGMTMAFAHQAGEKPKAYVFTVAEVPSEVFAIPQIGASIAFTVSRSMATPRGHDVRVQTYGSVRIVPDEPKSLDWFISQINKICTLLGYVGGTPLGPDRIQARHSAQREPLDVLVALRQDKVCDFDHANKFFMLRTALGDQLGPIIQQWFELYDAVEIASQLGFEVLASEGLWLHIEYLTLMHALEGFHRATSEGFYMPTEKYDAVRDAIIASIPPQVHGSHRSSLKSRIEYGNEISLSKRLADLANRLDDGLKRRLFGLDKKVPRSWVDTRNYCTHWDEKSRANALEGIEMHRASTRLRMLLRVLYLDLVGVPSDTIKAALDGQHDESQSLIHLNNSEVRARHPEARVQPLMSFTMSPAKSAEAAGESDDANDDVSEPS